MKWQSVVLQQVPGATNAITAVAGAWIESTPLIIISGQVKRADMLEGRKLRQTGVQEVEITKIVDKITKFACVIKEPNDTLYVLQKAYDAATTGRKGFGMGGRPLRYPGCSNARS